MKRAFTVPALVLAALLLAGCSSGMTSESDSGGSNGSVGEIAPMQDGTMQDGVVKDGSVDAGGFVPGAVSERAVITTGSVSLTATDPIGAADDAIKLVT